MYFYFQVYGHYTTLNITPLHDIYIYIYIYMEY